MAGRIMSGRDHNKAKSFAWCSLIANYIIFLHHSLFFPLLPHGLIDVVSNISSLTLAAALNSFQYILICQVYSFKIIAQYSYCRGLNSIYTSGGMEPVQLDMFSTHTSTSDKSSFKGLSCTYRFYFGVEPAGG